jgi:hypothetical protein
MRFKMRRYIACLLALNLSGCIPVISHEYDVIGQGEKSAAAGCSQSAEVALTAHPSPDVAIVFWSSVDRIRPNYRLVSISFALSNDDIVQLTKPEVLVSSKANSIPNAVPISTVRRASQLSSPSCTPPADAVYQQPSEAMHRMPGLLNGQPVTDSVFIVDVLVSGNPSQITVQLPSLLINDKPVDVPAVTFRRKLAVTY